MKIATIYQIKNIITNDCYIGSTTNFSRRKNAHFNSLNKGLHHSIVLQRAFSKYGEKSFIVNKIKVFPYFSKEDILSNEQYYLDRNNCKYNICKIAGSQLGSKRSIEFREKCSNRMKGTSAWNKGLKLPKHSEELSKKRSKSLKGHIVSTETKLKISNSNKGKSLSYEHKQKLSKSKFQNPVNNLIVEQYLNSVLVDTFISISEASRVTGLNYQTIKDNINNIKRKWKSKKNKWTWKIQIN